MHGEYLSSIMAATGRKLKTSVNIFQFDVISSFTFIVEDIESVY
jgi:hypothetical protein